MSSLAKFCRFPITRYEGEYRPTWTRCWTRIGGDGGSWQFFGHARDIVLDNGGEPYTWKGEFGFRGLFPMLAGPRNDWGAFDLVGLLQLDKDCNLKRVCGCACSMAGAARSGAVVVPAMTPSWPSRRAP